MQAQELSDSQVEMMRAVRAHTERWREWEELLDGFSRQVEELDDDGLAAAYQLVGMTVVGKVHELKDRLYQRYGILIEPERGVTVAERVRGMRLTQEGLPAFCEDVTDYIFWVALQHDMVEAMRASEDRCESQISQFRAGVCAVCQAWLDIQIKLMGAAMFEMPLDAQHLAASQLLSGWAASRIRLFGRLRVALGSSGRSPQAMKLLELPGAVIAAWSKRSGKEPLTGRESTLSEVARELQELGNESELAAKIQDEYPQPAEDAAAREEARQELDQLRQRAGLSPREAEVFALMMKEASEKEIAAELDVCQGTVKSFKSRLREKLRKAAGIV